MINNEEVKVKANQAVGVGSVVFALIVTAPIVVAEQSSQAQTPARMESERGYPSGPQGGITESGMTGGAIVHQDVNADDLDDMSVVNSSGDKIGELDEIVLSKQDNQLYAVVEVGGFLGAGEKEVVIPLKELTMRDGKLWAPLTASTQEQLKSRPEYDDSRYQEVSEEQRIDRSEFAAFELDQKPD